MRRTPKSSGYTLIELSLVLAIMLIIMAVAFPRLLPVILSSNLEGAARHFGGYGRAAMAQAVLSHENLVVKIDFERQEYWTERLLEPVDEEAVEGLDTESIDSGRNAMFSQTNPMRDSLFGGDASEEDDTDSLMDPAQMEEQAIEMLDDFDRYAMASLKARLRNVGDKEGILEGVGDNMFEEDFSLEAEGDEEEDSEELKTPILLRTRMPEDIVLESVRVGNETFTGGLVEIDVTPLGLMEPVVAYFKSEDGEYMTVAWDPITGGASTHDGKLFAEDVVEE